MIEFNKILSSALMLSLFLFFICDGFAEEKYILVTKYDENNYCSPISFKKTLSKLSEKDHNSFYFVFKGLDSFDIQYISKDYPSFNFIPDSELFTLGDFIRINEKDTTFLKIDLSANNRFELNVIDSVINNMKKKHIVIDVKEKLPIMLLPEFPLENFSVNNQSLLIMDSKNVIHEINLEDGNVEFTYQLTDSLSKNEINYTEENSNIMEFFFGARFRLSTSKLFIRKSTQVF